MTDKEFTEIAPSLSSAALHAAQTRGLVVAKAEDVAQDTMMRLWTLRESLNSAEHARALAIIVARHRACDGLRAQATVSLDAMPLGIHLEAATATDRALETTEADAWLQRRLNALPPLQYQVLHLRQVEGKTNGEIAAILAIPTASVATLLSRARHKLLEQIRRRNRHI